MIQKQMKNQEKQTQIELDSHGDPVMTKRTVRALCLIDGLPLLPELNDKLYLYEKGFRNILPLNMYENLISLWLNKNKIVKIENLEGLKNLMCLYLQDNLITKIQGLDLLSQLEILNLEKNKIAKVENLKNLAKLKNLSLAQNYLSTYQSIAELSELKKLTNLDISKNQIENSQDILNLVKGLTEISCLCLKATPFARGFKNYRKSLIGTLPALKFLDDRPIQESEHRLCEAWLLGGAEQQKKMRNKIQTEEKQSKRNFKNEIQTQQKVENSQQLKVFSQSVAAQVKNKEKLIDERVKVNLQPEPSPEQQTEGNMEEGIQQDHPKETSKSELNTSWNAHYQKILEALLEKYEFDFSEVQPRFNMIISEINKKLMRPTSRFEIDQLEKAWTEVEGRRRKDLPLL